MDRHANEVARARAGGFCEYLVIGDSWRSRHCQRKAVKNGRCKQHDPDEMRAAEAQRIAKRDAKWEADNRWRTTLRRGEAKRQVIAFVHWVANRGALTEQETAAWLKAADEWAEQEVK